MSTTTEGVAIIMTGAGSTRASHADYINAVVAALAEKEVLGVAVKIVDGKQRYAVMTVEQVEPQSSLWADVDAVELRWSESDGWSLSTVYDGARRPPVFLGFSAVPEPSAVADWVLIWLVHPNVTPSRDLDEPFQTPDMDVVLRAYTATKTSTE